MKTAASILVALILGFTVYISGAADQGSRPPGVRERDWVRVSEGMGFVITQTDGGGGGFGNAIDPRGQVLRADPESVGADLMPPLKGYFVIRTATGWRQIALSEPVVPSR